MIRITRKVFSDLAIWMTGFGLLIGIIFPFFVMLMGIPSNYVMTPWFFAVCITAGILVGASNVQLARIVVGKRLKLLADRMHQVQKNLEEANRSSEAKNCENGDCLIIIDSDDEIGESAQAFNHLVNALTISHKTETDVRTFTEMLSSHLEVNTLTEKALFQLLQNTNSQAGALLT